VLCLGKVIKMQFIREKTTLADVCVLVREQADGLIKTGEELSIFAQFRHVNRLYRAAVECPGPIVVSEPHSNREVVHVRRILGATGNRAMAFAGSNGATGAYMQEDLRSPLLRSAGDLMVECVRRVVAGRFWLPTQPMQSPAHASRYLRIDYSLIDRVHPQVSESVWGCNES
jgi:hypothetical protein